MKTDLSLLGAHLKMDKILNCKENGYKKCIFETGKVLQTSADPCGISAVCTKSRPELTFSTKYDFPPKAPPPKKEFPNHFNTMNLQHTFV